MAQQVALRCWAGRTGQPDGGRCTRWPIRRCTSGTRFASVSGLRDGPPDAASRGCRRPTEVRDFDEPFGTLMLELPLRDAGFRAAVLGRAGGGRGRGARTGRGGALRRRAPVGVRPALRPPAARRSRPSRTASTCRFYKSLGGLSGAVLAGPGDLVDEARAWRHRYGGQLFQQCPAALSALLGPGAGAAAAARVRGPRARSSPRRCARRSRRPGVPWFRVHPEEPHTHQFQVWLPYGTAS